MEDTRRELSLQESSFLHVVSVMGDTGWRVCQSSHWKKTHFLFELAPAIIMEYSKPVKSLPLWLSFPDKWGISTMLSLTTNNLRSFID